MRTVTYSRNVFIPVTDLCRNRCGYCGFWRDSDQARIITRQEAKNLLIQGAVAGCSEALFSMGESPWAASGYRNLVEESGVGQDMVSYLIELCEMAIELGLLPHTNAGLLSEEHLSRVASYNASMGLMLETTALVRAHKNSPGKRPDKRLEFIATAGRFKIPFTTGILVGIGEDKEDRIASLKALARLHETYGHIQEVIIQPFDPKPGTEMADVTKPSIEIMKEAVSLARKTLPKSVAIQVPPNLVEPRPLIEAGASDIGGLSPITLDWINPERPWPDLSSLGLDGFSLKERLPIYPRYVLDGWYSKRIERNIKALTGTDGLRFRANMEVEYNAEEVA